MDYALPSWIDKFGFLVTGPLDEEVLFRGAVVSLAERVPGASDRQRTKYAIQKWYRSRTRMSLVAGGGEEQDGRQ